MLRNVCVVGGLQKKHDPIVVQSFEVCASSEYNLARGLLLLIIEVFASLNMSEDRCTERH